MLNNDQKTKVDIKICFGMYEPCGGDVHNFGYHLPMIKLHETHVKLKTMIKLEITCNIKNVNKIVIKDASGAPAQTRTDIKLKTKFFFEHLYADIDCMQKIYVYYYTDSIIEASHIEEIKIPSLIIKNIYDGIVICPICLENINENEYITPCAHSYHLDCIKKCIKTKKVIFCYVYCKNIHSVIPFNCPVCKKKLEDNY
jgi:hypothetical protein